jgi:hypothetical protein
MKTLISFCILSLFLFTVIANKTIRSQKKHEEATLYDKSKLLSLSFTKKIKRPSEELVKQISKLEKSVRRAESEIDVIKETLLCIDSTKFHTFVKKDTLVKKDSVVLKKKSLYLRVIDTIKY